MPATKVCSQHGVGCQFWEARGGPLAPHNLGGPGSFRESRVSVAVEREAASQPAQEGK